MDLRFSAADLAFAAEVREWLHDHLTGRFAVLVGKGGSQNEEFYDLRVEWERELHAGGWTGLGWPEEYGGRPATITQRVLFEYEYAKARAPYRAGFQGMNLLGPTLIAHGSPEQKQRFLPRILSGDEVWCQGFSEPGRRLRPGRGADQGGARRRRMGHRRAEDLDEPRPSGRLDLRARAHRSGCPAAPRPVHASRPHAAARHRGPADHEPGGR